MLIQVHPSDIHNIVFKDVPPRQFSPAYLAEREQIWLAEIDKAVHRRDLIWNGILYTVEDIYTTHQGLVVFSLGTCEFKDLVFRNIKGVDYISEVYGMDHLVRPAGVACIPVTTDSRFVFGIRGDFSGGGTHPTGLIGGTLNWDETVVHTWNDVCTHLRKEMGEETQLPYREEDLTYFGVFVHRSMYLFVFWLRLALSSSEVGPFFRPGEFSRMVALTAEEAQDPALNATGVLRGLSKYLPWIPVNS